jgi:hypothetical protein
VPSNPPDPNAEADPAVKKGIMTARLIQYKVALIKEGNAGLIIDLGRIVK